MNGWTIIDEHGTPVLFCPMPEDQFHEQRLNAPFPQLPLPNCSFAEEEGFIINFYLTFVSRNVRENQFNWQPMQLVALEDMYREYVMRWNVAGGRGATTAGFNTTYNTSRERLPNEPPVSWTQWAQVLFEEDAIMRGKIQTRID